MSITGEDFLDHNSQRNASLLIGHAVSVTLLGKHKEGRGEESLLIAWFNWRAPEDPQTIYFRLLRDGQKEMTIEELDVLE